MEKTVFSALARGDQFIGSPHGGWKFIKTDTPGLAVRIADGGTVKWKSNAEVYKVQKISCHQTIVYVEPQNEMAKKRS